MTEGARQALATEWRLGRDSKRAIALILAACWAASLALPVATPAQGAFLPGYLILMVGWLGLVVLQPGWLANLLLWPVLVMLSVKTAFRRTLLICGVSLLLFGLSALGWDDFPDDAGSNYLRTFHSGYYVWLLATFGAGLCALILPVRRPAAR